MNVLLLLHPGLTSRSILLDAGRGFERAGHRVLIRDMTGMWAAYERDAASKPRLMSGYSAELRAFIKAEGIGAAIGMWGNGLLSFMNSLRPGGPGEPARAESFFDAIGCPHVLLWLDAPHWAHEGTFVQHCGTTIVRGSRLLHVINNDQTAREMTEVLGFTNVLARRYGVCEETFRPWPGEEKEFDLVFASGPGDPAPTAAAFGELGAEEPDMSLVRGEGARLALGGVGDLSSRAGAEAGAVEELLRALVAAQLADRDEPMMDRFARFAAGGMERAVRRVCAEPRLFVDATARVRSVERFERAFTLAYLARRFRVGLMGNGDYSAWECRAAPLGYAAHEEQSRGYARGRLGLNVMRWQDDAGLNLKCFEITASGAACLTTARRGLREVFDDSREVATFVSPAGAARAARELLESPERLGRIAEAGRARTLHDHTWTAWARDVVARLPR